MKHIAIILPLFIISISALAVPISIPNASFEAELVSRGYDTDGLVNGQMDNTDVLALTYLDLSNSNSMSGALDLTDFINIGDLVITHASINAIDITTITGLTGINLQFLPNLTSIDLSNNTNLNGVAFIHTGIASIDLKTHPNIYTGSISNNLSLTELKLNSNIGAGTIYFQFDNNNPLLTCIEVDNLAAAQAKVNNFTWLTGGQTLSLSCPPPVASVVMLPTSITLPQLSNSAISVISNPQPGMMTWSTDDNCVKVYNGTSWNCL